MANTIKKGESLFIPFENGESIYDSQLKPRMYKTKEQYDKFSYRFGDAEMVEYAEVVRCKDCKHLENHCRCRVPLGAGLCNDQEYILVDGEDDFCSYGERREGE